MLIYHSPLVKGKTRKRKMGGAGTLCGKKKSTRNKMPSQIDYCWTGGFPCLIPELFHHGRQGRLSITHGLQP